MAEQLEEQPVAEQEPVAPVADTQPTQPQPAPYIDRVYSALKDNLSGFNKTPEQFKEAMKDSTYAAKAYGALKDNLAGFNKTPDQFYQEVGVAKKAQPSGGLNTLPSSSNGSSPFLSSPQPTELTPVLPQYREQVKERQQQQAQQLSDQLKSLRNSMDDQHKADFDKALQMSTDQGQLAPVTKEEQDHYNYMQTPLGKTLGSVAYLGSQATHGTLQIAKGLAHVASLANNPAAAMSGTDNIDKAFEGADKFADMGLTKGDIARIETGNTLGNHILSTAGQLANFAPAIAGGEVGETGGVLPKALFYLQGVGAGKEAADKIPGLNPVAKEALIQGTGAVNLALTDLGGNLFNKGVSNSLKDKVVTGIAADAIKEAAGKSVSEDGFKNLIDGQVKSFVDKFQRAPQEALSHYVDAAKTFTKLDVGNFAVHKAVDALQSANGDQPVFNENLGNLAESLNKSYTQTAPLFSALGAGRELTKLLPNSVYANDVTKAIIEDPTQTNVDDIKQKIAQHGSEQGWSPEELKATNEHIDKIANATASLPSDIKDKPKAVGLVLDRNTLQAELDQSAGERAKLDPAVADIPSAKEQYLTDKIAQANDKLRSLVTGNRTTYSKGVAEEQGKFFKTTGGEKEEIEPSRYDLESNEREAKKQTNEQVYINETGNVAAPVDLKETEIKNQIKSIDSMVNSITDHQPKNSTEIAENETILKSLKKHRDILTSQLKEPSNEQKNESVPTAEEVQPKPVENEQPSAEAPVENAVTPDQPVEKNNNKFNDFADRVGATETDVDGKTRITPEGSNVHLELVPDPKDPNAVHIGMIRTSADMFKKGLASKKMDEITKLADEQKMPIHLSVANEGENVGWLKSFYKKYGFVEQEHPNENLRDEMQYMYREPKPTGKAEIKAGDPLRVFADKVRQGKINKLGGFKASTGFDSVWDGSLEVVAKAIEGGAKIADAIETGLNHIKESDWYKSLTDKADFDSQYRDHLTNEYAEHEKEAVGSDEPKAESTDGKVKKKILTQRAYEGDISDDVKKHLEEKGLTRESFTQEERSKQATDFINKFGEDAAYRAVKAGDIDGGMAASILAQLQIKNSRAMSDMAKGSEERDLLAKKQANYIDLAEKKGYLGGEFNGQLAYEYQNAELNYASVKRQVEKITGKSLTPDQEKKVKSLTDENEALKNKLQESEAKLIEETDKAFNAGKEAAKDETKAERAKRLANKLRENAKIHRPGVFNSATPATLAWDAAVEIVAKSIEAGGKIADAIDAGLDHIKNTDWYKNLPDNKKILAEKEFKRYSNDNSGSTDLADLQERFVDKTDNKFTHSEAADIWGYMKENYLDKGSSYRDALSKVATDLGLSWRQVSEAVITPKTKRMSDEMWKRQADYTRNRTAIQNWVGDQKKSIAGKILNKVSGAFRGLAVFGHGGIFVGTHAGMTMFNPSMWNKTIPAFFRGWKFAYGNEADYERSIEELKNSQNYLIAQRAGLKNNPERLNSEEFQKSQKFLGKLGLAGEKGFNAIKVLRQDLFDYHYNRLAAADRDDPEVAKSIAHIVNLATGATNLKIPGWVNEASFAGGMEASRWERLTANPAKATNTALKAIFTPDKVSTADRVFAKVWSRRVGEQLATYTGALLANAAIQNQLNPKNPVNLTHPDKPDFLKFKLGDVTIDPTSGMRSVAAFMYKLGKVPFEDQKELKGDKRVTVAAKDLGNYARGKLAPLYGTLADVFGGADFNNNPLPYSHDRPNKYAHRLSWTEYGLSKVPLPIAEAAHVAYQSAIDNGADKNTLHHVLRGIMSGAVSGTTGFRVGEYDASLPTNQGEDEATKKLSKIKAKIDVDGVETEVNYELTPEQVKDREDVNAEYLKENKEELNKKYSEKAKHDSQLQERIKTLEKEWKRDDVSADEQKASKEKMIKEFIDRKIQAKANEHSRKVIYQKYKGSLKKVDDE